MSQQILLKARQIPFLNKECAAGLNGINNAGITLNLDFALNSFYIWVYRVLIYTYYERTACEYIFASSTLELESTF